MNGDSGRRIVIAIIIFTLLCEAVAIATAMPRFGLSRLPRQLVRLALEIWLCVSLYRGRNWARIVVGILGALAAVAAIAFVGVFHERLGPTALTVVAILAIGEGAISILLFGSSSVRHYFSDSGSHV